MTTVNESCFQILTYTYVFSDHSIEIKHVLFKPVENIEENEV